MTALRERMVQDMKIRGFTPGTQDKYLEAIEALAQHYHRPPDQLTQEQLRAYLLHLIESRQLAKSTFRRHLSALKFLYRRTLGWSWPVLALPRIQSEKKLPVVLSREEVWCLLDQVRKPAARMSLLLMYTCGLRVSEALHLRVEDIDSQRRVVWVRNGKGAKDRSVPLPQQTLAEALLKLTADPHYVGGLVGVMAVLHPWGSTLTYHPHVHCLVTGGGVSADGQQWRPARPDYLVPVQALSKLFRGLVLDRLRRRFPEIELPSSVRQKDWVVHGKPAVQGTQRVLEYLGRYIHRVALTNSRLVALENGQVTFRYRDSRTGQTKTMRLEAQEFLRRFLPHVLPRGVHKVRYYGLWSPSHRDQLHRWQDRLAPEPVPASAPEPTRSPRTAARETPSPPPTRPCPYCKTGTLVYVRRLPPQGRPPP